MDATSRRVLETEELLEGILSFLPFKNLFYVRRVSKRWAGLIDRSANLQQKMFLRPRDLPELWAVDRRHRPGANSYRKGYKHLNNTDFRFRRVKAPEDDKKSATPAVLNPLLDNDHISYSGLPNALRVATGCEIEVVTHRSWTDALWDGNTHHPTNASFWNTFLADPPCHKVEVQLFSLRLDDIVPPTRPSNLHPNPIMATVSFPDSQRLTIESSAGVRMRDVLLASLTTRGDAQGGRVRGRSWRGRDSTVRDVVEAVSREVGSEGISERWGVFFRLRLCKVGDAQVLLATDEERVAANLGWR
jgi:hypothetical protein